MASFAPGRFTVQACLPHALLELPFVRINVTGSAIQVLPAVNGCRLLAELRRFLVAIAAGHRHVPTRQKKARLLVTSQRERGWPISVERVALVALVQVGSRSKLGGVTIAVTIRTKLELDLVERVFCLRSVTLPALQACVPALQGIGGYRMFFNAEPCRFESFDGVTGRAIAAVSPLRELPTVWIGPMAIRALFKCHRLLEITTRVAFHALHLCVFPEQGIFRF